MEEKAKELEIVSIPTDDKAAIEITPFGSDERIKLSVSIIQKLIAVPTRTGKIPDANACIKFMMLCRARHLNPFDGDCFMLGYDTQSGPQFSLITAHQVFLKRAEASKGFNGMESGVIVKHQDEIVEREGDITFSSEELLGGWAKVYRKDREHPFYRRLKLSTFNTNRSRWEKDPAGMITKCAEADALRSAFPSHLGGLYVEEERPPIDIESEPVIKRAKVPKNFPAPVLAEPKALGEKPIVTNDEARESTENRDRMGEGSSMADSLGGEKPLSGGVERDSAKSEFLPVPVFSPTTDHPSAAQPSKKKLKGLRSPEPVPDPNRAEVTARISKLGKTPDDLVRVAKLFNALDENGTWNDLDEEKFGVFLIPGNWEMVVEALS